MGYRKAASNSLARKMRALNGDTYVILTKQTVNELVRQSAETCVSLYMPSHQAGREQRQNQIRFKNLVADAEELLAHEPNAAEANILLGRIQHIAEDKDHVIWQHPASGLAVLATPQDIRFFHLPVEVKEQVHVGERFYLKPLLPIIQSDGRYFAVAVSQKQVRLFEGTRNSIRELHPKSLPSDLEDALNIDEYVSTLQFHSHPHGNSAEAIYHGHGGAGNDDAEIVQFFHRLDDAIGNFLSGQSDPLIFIGVEELFPIFKECVKYPHLAEQAVEGNFDDVPAETLHQSVLEKVQPYFDKQVDRAIESIEEAYRRDRVCSDVEPLLRAAERGAVDTLLLRKGASCWGHLDVDGHVEVHDEPQVTSLDLLDEAAFETLTSGGKVFILEDDRFPEIDSPCAALLRLPVQAATAN